MLSLLKFILYFYFILEMFIAIVTISTYARHLIFPISIGIRISSILLDINRKKVYTAGKKRITVIAYL